MYGKIFEQMYRSTVAETWEALVTFQQLIVLADDQGVVDSTPESIARTTNIPLKIIQKGLAKLEQPDPKSRSSACEGRRIVRLDEHREWGWMIVNYQRYRDMASRSDRAKATTERVRRWRERQKKINENNDETLCNTTKRDGTPETLVTQAADEETPATENQSGTSDFGGVKEEKKRSKNKDETPCNAMERQKRHTDTDKRQRQQPSSSPAHARARGAESDGREVTPIPDDWTPDGSIYLFAQGKGFDREATDGLVPEFIRYWQARDEWKSAGEWRRKFINWVNREHAERNSRGPNGGANDAQQQKPGRSGADERGRIIDAIYDPLQRRDE